jgi:dsDNA-specific endonuclease/ATPase MutS2
MHEINIQLKDSTVFEAINKGAQMVKQMGGSFTAHDVAELLEICAVRIFNADQSHEYAEMKRAQNYAFWEAEQDAKKEVREEVEQLREEKRKAEEKADAEYERALNELRGELDDAKERADDYEEKAELYDNLENSIHPEIFDAVCSMIPGDRLTFAEAYEVAEKIRNCGKFDASQLRMAI